MESLSEEMFLDSGEKRDKNDRDKVKMRSRDNIL